MEYVGSTTLLFIIVKVVMYDMPWTLILILGRISKGLLNEKSIVHKLNGTGYYGGNFNFHLNPSIIVFTSDLPSKNTSSTIFF